MSENEESFDQFFRRGLPSLVKFLVTLGFGREEAEDAAAHAMTQAYQRWDGLRTPAAWVRVVAQRAAARAATRRAYGIRRAAGIGWAPEVCADPDPTVFKEEQRTVLNLLHQLPRQQRTVLAWTMDGFTITEIGCALDIPTSTVRSHLRHARRRILELAPYLKPGELRDSAS